MPSRSPFAIASLVDTISRPFRVATGILEVEGATMLSSHGLRTAGVLQLSLLMLGPVYTHVKTPGEYLRAIIPAAMSVDLTHT